MKRLYDHEADISITFRNKNFNDDKSRWMAKQGFCARSESDSVYGLGSTLKQALVNAIECAKKKIEIREAYPDPIDDWDNYVYDNRTTVVDSNGNWLCYNSHKLRFEVRYKGEGEWKSASKYRVKLPCYDINYDSVNEEYRNNLTRRLIEASQ